MCFEEPQEIEPRRGGIRVHAGPLFHHPHQDTHEKHYDRLSEGSKENCALPMRIHFASDERRQDGENVDGGSCKVKVYKVSGTHRELCMDALGLEDILMLCLM